MRYFETEGKTGPVQVPTQQGMRSTPLQCPCRRSAGPPLDSAPLAYVLGRRSARGMRRTKHVAMRPIDHAGPFHLDDFDRANLLIVSGAPALVREFTVNGVARVGTVARNAAPANELREVQRKMKWPWEKPDPTFTFGPLPV